MKALQLIYNKLLDGEMFGIINKHRQGGTYFWTVLNIGYSNGGQYIFWNHYGSSANRVSLDSLEWIIREIFRTTPEEFLFKHTTYNEWKRIHNCYDSKDMGLC